MNFDRNIAAMLLAPLIGLAVPVTVFFWKMPPGELTRTETELLKFSSQQLVVLRPKAAPPYSGVQNPVLPPKVKQATQTPAAAFPSGPIPSAGDIRQKPVPTSVAHIPEVSMIYNDSGSKMAIINGHVLHEGSVIAGYTIVKIDKQRVLARTNGKEIWLSLE